MTTTLDVAGVSYTFAPITIEEGEALDSTPEKEAAVTFIAACLKAGGHGDATPQWVKKTFPRWIDGKPSIAILMEKAYEANGVKFKVPVAGENQPAGPALVTESA
jgi:hypothetical protein